MKIQQIFAQHVDIIIKGMTIESIVVTKVSLKAVQNHISSGAFQSKHVVKVLQTDSKYIRLVLLSLVIRDTNT